MTNRLLPDVFLLIWFCVGALFHHFHLFFRHLLFYERHITGRLRIYSEGKLSDPVKGLPKIEYHGPNPDGSIPQDNPFINRKGVRTDIWSFGHRNPLGAALNPTSKQLWIHEMGAVHGDELNIPLAGQNYGWPLVSNGDNYDGSRIPDHETKPEFARPIEIWLSIHSESCMGTTSGSIIFRL